jgi:HPt (histidine-containing phosphotransfer) domain-containing protein
LTGVARRCENAAVSAIDLAITSRLAADLPRTQYLLILETFEADLDRLAMELEQAAAAGDLDGYRRAAHSLAGTSAAVGASELERAARSGMDPRNTDNPALMARRIRQKTDAAVAALAALAGAPA